METSSVYGGQIKKRNHNEDKSGIINTEADMKASVYIATTLDGFIARENGELDWLPGSEGEATGEGIVEDHGFNAFFDSVDVLVMGRKTYQFVVSSEQWFYGDKRVVVLSTTLPGIAPNLPATVQLRRDSPAELYRALEKEGVKHLYIDGGKTIQGFLEAGLIDEIIITRIPVLIGSGIPLFGALAQDITLRHIKTHSFDNGLVQSQYAVTG